MNTPKILNAGCGRDLSIGTDFIDAAPFDNRVIQCDLDTDRFPYDTGSFDEVVAFSVFEHLTNHAHFMHECHRVLKEGGRLTLTTDNASCLSFVFLYEHGEIIENWRKGDAHYGLFTIRHLQNYAEKFGFKAVSGSYERGKPSENPIKRGLQSILPKKLAAYGIKVVMEKC